MFDLIKFPGIAVIDMHGVIGRTIRPLEYARLLSRLCSDRSVRAVVLNINSPGGDAAGSELISRAVRRLGRTKPVATFVGGVGASGGYMVASASHRIFALPSSIIGSIGVISYRPVIAQLLERVGVQMQVSKSGRLKDMTSPFRQQTEEERAKEQQLLDSFYELFVASVAEDRELPLERVRELASGEIWLAADALDSGLIDATGDLEDAIDWTVEQTGTPRRVRLMRPRRSLRDVVLGGASATFAETVVGEFESALQGGVLYLYTGSAPSLKG